MSEGLFFTREELDQVDADHLRNIATYLDIEHRKNTSKEKLILLILQYQVERQPYFADAPPQVPRYSVRVQRIMDLKEKGTL